MNEVIFEEKIKELISFLNHHQALYDAGVPQISDKEWDEKYFELVRLERDYPNLIQNNSPTQKIIFTTVSKLNKVQHEVQPMLSLDKTKDIKVIENFVGNKSWLAMLKLDGLTCRLTYKNGKLFRAETRGNGIEGEDITHNAMVLSSIPKKINYYGTYIVDGEIICKIKDFESFSSDFANTRNFAAGSIRLLDSEECAKRKLMFVAWDNILGSRHNNLSDKLSEMDAKGFITVPRYKLNSCEQAINALCRLNDHPSLLYPIDGIVFKFDNCEEYFSAGRTEHHFCGGLAYKFYDEEYETELINIEWSMGRSGILTPVAIYKDIEIDGAICNRASLHNISIMTELLGECPYVGQKIWVYRSNMIIPQISRSKKLNNLGQF